MKGRPVYPIRENRTSAASEKLEISESEKMKSKMETIMMNNAYGAVKTAESKKLNERARITVAAAVFGSIAFLIIYGITPLNVTNDNWIMAGYDEVDIIQHYAGWLAFRNSKWAFPLGIACDMAVGTGTFISYTDSIPWVSIFFKLFRDILPATFQFFGIYALLCYILQSTAAVNIIYEKSHDAVYSLIGMAFFSFAPIMMERSLRHTALGAQWLILFAIFVFIRHREKQKRSHYLCYLLLLVLAIGIHPYFLPSIAVFMLLSLIDDLRKRNWISVVFFFADLVVTYGAGCLIGVLGSGVEPSRGGYGYYSMNLNALVNPTSVGGYNWSAFMKVHPQILGNYDGFNYLGFGIVISLFLLLVLCISYGKGKGVLAWLKRNWYVAAILFACAAFAVSNVVTFNDKTIANIPIPTFLADLCGIFRASSRIFYPVYYCIFIGIIVSLWHFKSELGIRKTRAFLLIIAALQLFDLNGVIIQKHAAMKTNAGYDSLLTDDNADRIFSDKNALLLDSYSGDNRRPAVVALKHGMKLYYSVANSGAYDATNTEAAEILEEIKQTGDIGRYVVATDDMNVVNTYLGFNNIFCYERDGTYYLSSTAVSLGEHVSRDSDNNHIYHYRSGKVQAADFTDENWTKGYSNSSNVLLFNRDDLLLNDLVTHKSIAVRDNTYSIVSVDYDDLWIRVELDRNASDCQYPAVLEIK